MEVLTVVVRTQKWGNSLALRIPKPFAEEAAVREGTRMDLSLARGKLVAAPVAKKPVTLGRLLQRVSRKNLHTEIETTAEVLRKLGALIGSGG